MRLSTFLSKILQTVAILLCSELLFLPLVCSLGLGLLALASLLLFCLRGHSRQAATNAPEAANLHSIRWSQLPHNG
jgi:hypothetical protein